VRNRTGASAHFSTEQIINSEDAGRHIRPYRPHHVAADDLGSCGRHWRPDWSPLSPSNSGYSCPVDGELGPFDRVVGVAPRAVRTLMIRQDALVTDHGDEVTGSADPAIEVPRTPTHTDKPTRQGSPDAVEGVVTGKQILAGDLRAGDTVRTNLKQSPFGEPRWHWLRVVAVDALVDEKRVRDLQRPAPSGAHQAARRNRHPPIHRWGDVPGADNRPARSGGNTSPTGVGTDPAAQVQRAGTAHQIRRRRRSRTPRLVRRAASDRPRPQCGRRLDVSTIPRVLREGVARAWDRAAFTIAQLGVCRRHEWEPAYHPQLGRERNRLGVVVAAELLASSSIGWAGRMTRGRRKERGAAAPSGRPRPGASGSVKWTR
jgi:hypothetical protein